METPSRQSLRLPSLSINWFFSLFNWLCFSSNRLFSFSTRLTAASSSMIRGWVRLRREAPIGLRRFQRGLDLSELAARFEPGGGKALNNTSSRSVVLLTIDIQKGKTAREECREPHRKKIRRVNVKRACPAKGRNRRFPREVLKKEALSETNLTVIITAWWRLCH